MSATLFTLREVNDASFPDHAMSGHLDELLRSPGSQPVRCVATAPGHVVVSVAGGKYLHAFSARTPRPARVVGATPTEPTLAPSFSLAPNERDERSRSSLERTERSWEDDDRAWERTEESFLSFHGASRVARVVFVPLDASNATPLALLAAQEDGGVAAWRWCCEDTEPEPRWVPCAPPAFAGGPPLVAAPFDDAYVTENGFVFDAALLAARAAEGRRRVRLACLTSGPSASGSRGATRGTPKTPTLVVIDVGFLDVVLEGKADCAVLLRAETAGRNAREDAANLSPRAVLALGPVPRAAAVLSAGGDEFWVVSGGTGGSNEDTVVTRWSSCVAGETRATRRVDLSLAARVADAAAAASDASASARAAPEISGNFQTFPAASRPNSNTRLATCLHSPSHELLAVTERGNVLCLSPGLRGFDAEASVSQASENEKQKTHSTRHVGRLRGGDFVASADFEAMESRDGPRVAAREPRFATIDLHSIIARGPFLYLAHKSWADNTTSIEKTATRETREEPSAFVSAYHLSSGVALGTVPIPAAPPLARGSGDATEEDSSCDGLVVRLVDGGAARALVTATAHGRAAGVFVVDPPPAAATLARAYVGRGDRKSAIERERVSFSSRIAADGTHERNGLSDEGPTDRSSPIGVSVASLRAARRECAWFGGALERLDASAALALAELEMKERARGRSLSALSFDRDANATANANDSDDRFDAFVSKVASPTRARVVERALAACFRTRNHRERPDTRERHDERDERDECDEFAAFAAFSELGAASGAAIAAPGSENAASSEDIAFVSAVKDEGERRRGRFDETIGPFSMTECPPEDVASLRAGLAALDAAAAVPAPWERGAGTRRGNRTGIPGPEVRTEERAIAEEGRDTLRAVAASIRASQRVEKKRTGSETDRPRDAAPEAETLETLDDFQSVRAFLAAADANRDYKYRDPASSMEVAATLLAETAVVRDAGEGATDDEDDPFASACACAHAARPRLAVWLVARAAARAAEAGVFPDARAAARVLATRALAAAPPVPEERAHDAAAASRAALLSLAGHAHAATWLLLTRGAARGEGARREVLADAEDEAPKRGRADEREDARTSSFGWGFAARLLDGEARADLASAGGVFETLASALRRVARRDATGEVSGASSDEVDPGMAAAQTLRAATTLAEAMETRIFNTREGTHAEDRSRRIERKDKDAPWREKKSGSVSEFGTDALERLVAAAAARVAATTEELEKTAKAHAA